MRQLSQRKRIEKEFALLSDELRDFDPGAFDRLRDRFFILLPRRLFRKTCCEEWLKEGSSPARKWLEVNGYPKDSDEAGFLLWMRSLTDESKKAYLVLFRRFNLIYCNSAAFRKRCSGRTMVDNEVLFMRQEGFEPAYKADVEKT